MMLQSGELELIISAAGVVRSERQRRYWANHAGGIVDWAPVLEGALAHGTLSLLCTHLLALDSSVVDPEIHEAARVFLAGQARAHQLAMQQWTDLLECFDEAGIVTIPFKGPMLGAYYGDPTLRGFRDFDFLVREADFVGSIRLLNELGYVAATTDLPAWQRSAIQRRARQDTLYPLSGMAVEPHSAFAQRSLGLNLETDAVFERSTWGTVGGRMVRMMSPEDTFLVMALHGGKECWSRLIWLVDVAEFVRAHPTLDWDVIAERAKANGLGRVLSLCSTLAADLLGTPVPSNARDIDGRTSSCRALAEEVKRRLADPGAERGWRDIKAFQISLLDRQWDRFQSLVKSTLEVREEDYGSVDLPKSMAAGYVVVKALRRVANWF